MVNRCILLLIVLLSYSYAANIQLLEKSSPLKEKLELLDIALQSMDKPTYVSLDASPEVPEELKNSFIAVDAFLKETHLYNELPSIEQCKDPLYKLTEALTIFVLAFKGDSSYYELILQIKQIGKQIYNVFRKCNFSFSLHEINAFVKKIEKFLETPDNYIKDVVENAKNNILKISAKIAEIISYHKMGFYKGLGTEVANLTKIILMF